LAPGAIVVGRPRGGAGKGGEPEKIRDYPKLSITVKPLTKALLRAASALEGRSTWLIIEDAVRLYVERMTAADRDAIINLAKQSSRDR
jgi:hypothetical protein